MYTYASYGLPPVINYLPDFCLEQSAAVKINPSLEKLEDGSAFHTHPSHSRLPTYQPTQLITLTNSLQRLERPYGKRSVLRRPFLIRGAGKYSD